MGLDSVELVLMVEKYFSISIPDSKAEKAFTVGKLVDCVASILNIERYDFSLRINTFNKIKEHLQLLSDIKKDFLITDKVIDSLDIENKDLVIHLENHLHLEFPGIIKSEISNNKLLQKLQAWLTLSPFFDFTKITWKKYIDVLLSFNLATTINPDEINSKYEIYLAIMNITVEKIGVDYFEIGIEKSFTDDLGVD